MFRDEDNYYEDSEFDNFENDYTEDYYDEENKIEELIGKYYYESGTHEQEDEGEEEGLSGGYFFT